MNTINEVVVSAGGKGVNVARILSKLGEKVCIISFKGGYLGQWIEDEMKKEGALSFFVEVEGETRIHSNFISRADNSETEIIEVGPTIYEDSIKLFNDIFDEVIKKTDLLICSGSLPKGINDDFYKKLIVKANSLNIKTIIDTSKAPLKEAIEAKPLMIKPNLEELSYYAERELVDIPDIINVGISIIEKGVEFVLVSMGKNGSLLISNDDNYICKVPEHNCVNSNGCGDALVAGFVSAIINNKPIEYALRKGMACAVSNLLDKRVGNIDTNDIVKHMNEVEIMKV